MTLLLGDFWSFLRFGIFFIFLYEITLEAIDIDNVACWVFRTMFFTLGPLRNLEVFGTEV